MTVEERLSHVIGDVKDVLVIGAANASTNVYDDANVISISADSSERDIKETLSKFDDSTAPTIFLTDGVELIPVMTVIGECVTTNYVYAIDTFGSTGDHIKMINKLRNTVHGKQSSVIGSPLSVPQSVLMTTGDIYDSEENYIPY